MISPSVAVVVSLADLDGESTTDSIGGCSPGAAWSLPLSCAHTISWTLRQKIIARAGVALDLDVVKEGGVLAALGWIAERLLGSDAAELWWARR